MSKDNENSYRRIFDWIQQVAVLFGFIIQPMALITLAVELNKANANLTAIRRSIDDISYENTKGWIELFQSIEKRFEAREGKHMKFGLEPTYKELGDDSYSENNSTNKDVNK